MVLVIAEQQAHLIQISLVMILGEMQQRQELKFLRYGAGNGATELAFKFLWSECWYVVQKC
jgi:hypothetical protein